MPMAYVNFNVYATIVPKPSWPREEDAITVVISLLKVAQGQNRVGSSICAEESDFAQTVLGQPAPAIVNP